jgi:hypothetical protein
MATVAVIDRTINVITVPAEATPTPGGQTHAGSGPATCSPSTAAPTGVGGRRNRSDSNNGHDHNTGNYQPAHEYPPAPPAAFIAPLRYPSPDITKSPSKQGIAIIIFCPAWLRVKPVKLRTRKYLPVCLRRKQPRLRYHSRPSPPSQSCPVRPQRKRSTVPMTRRFGMMLHGCSLSPDAWGRLNVVTPLQHLSGDSHVNHSLGTSAH